MKNSISLLSVFMILFWVSCKKNVSKSSVKEIKSFKIEAANNTGVLQQDIVATIQNEEIKLDIPQGILIQPLKATFTYEGVNVSVNGIEQVSGASIIDFSKPITYKVTAENGSQVSYNITINAIEDSGLKFASFGFKKLYNQSLAADVVATKNGDTLAFILKGYTKALIPTFTTEAKEVLISTVKQTSNATKQDFSEHITYVLKSAYGQQKEVIVKVTWKNIPRLSINTTGNVDITSKDDYLTATIKLDGNGLYPDYSATTKIKGRGNSTWGAPKKPYRLKLDQKASLCGMVEDKDYVLLANYLDPTQMLNAVALKAGQLLDMPYVNHVVPVDLFVNGVFKGNYMLTEQVTVGAGRINIKDGGTLLELDSYFDEAYKFRSDNYQLPINIKYPDLTDQAQVAPLKADFEKLENLVNSSNFPNNNYADYIDLDQLANYVLITDLVCNLEIGHPKSVYMFKPKNGKYIAGPLWDFDWAFGYAGDNFDYFKSTTYPIFLFQEPGSDFYKRFFMDQNFKTKYKQKWNDFKASKMPKLLTYLDDYALLIGDSYAMNYTLWPGGTGNLDGYKSSIKVWLQGRTAYLDNYVSGF
ncbi:hypothetical protein ACVWYG_000647 [Pedobacter sp. UYEF25]